MNDMYALLFDSHSPRVVIAFRCFLLSENRCSSYLVVGLRIVHLFLSPSPPPLSPSLSLPLSIYTYIYMF